MTRIRDAQYSLVGPTLKTHQLEALKWVAVVTMTIGHAADAFSAQNLIYFYISRVAYPLFAFMLVYNYIHNTKNPTNYFMRIFIMSIIAELPYQYLFGRDIYLANILVTIGFGLASIIIIDRLIEQKDNSAYDVRWAWVGWYLVGIIVLIGGFGVDYMHMGILLCIAYWGWLRFPSYTTFYIALVATFLLNLPIGPTESFIGIIALGLIAVATLLQFKIPRINKWFFYLYYPMHIVILAAIKSVCF